MDFNLADLFERVTDTVPERTAVVTPDHSLSYAALDERASRFAHYLLDVGVRPGDHVGIHSYNRPEWCEAMLGCYKARAVPINVNYRYVPDELRYLFDNADLVALVFEASFTEAIRSVLPGLPKLQHLIVLDDVDQSAEHAASVGAVPYETALRASSPVRDFAPRSPDDLYILYTGGTTGMPKGVMWRQEDIFFAAMGGGNYGGPPITSPEQITSSLRDEGRTLALAPLMHGNAQWTMYNTLYLGGTLGLWTDHRFEPGGIWRFVARERVAIISVVGDAMARPLVDALREEPGEYDVSSVVAIVSGGAILSPSIKNDMHELLPNVFVLDSFGASETGANGVVDPNAEGPRFAMNDSTLVIGDDFRPVAPGETGMLARRGHVPLGYYKDREKTAATFVEVDGVRWAIPGDRAVREPDGTITVLGRGSQSINTGGEKVFPEEVEAVLKSHPDIFDAIVVGVPDERWGERVAAVVEPRPNRKPTLDDVTQHCRHALAGYKLPRDLVLVAEVKRTPAGKPDYRWAKAAATEALATP
jgi:acyl-CoA synthetase (AMP-forming)/AMP-acid ligase II